VRCFVALNLSSELRSRLAWIQDQLKAAAAEVSWVNPENIHLTLKFLGEVEEARLPAVRVTVQEALQGEEGVWAMVAGLGAFPPSGPPRVIWAGIRAGGEDLARLQARIEAALERIGFPRESRRFTPHLTLGRMRSSRGSPALLELISSHRGVELGILEAESVELMESRLHPSGAIYTVLESYPLSPSGRRKGKDGREG